MPAIKFRGVDFIDFDALLNDDERLVRDTARSFIEDNLVPIIEECNRAGRFPRELVKPMADLGFFGASLNGYGSDEQKNTWLPAMQKGEKLGWFGLTEPDFGSNPGGMRTRAKKVGKEYVLNGEKMWITSGSIADVAVIWAKVEDEVNPLPEERDFPAGSRARALAAAFLPHTIRGFLVETDRPGFRAEDIHGKWSLRASVTSSLSLQDVHVPESAL